MLSLYLAKLGTSDITNLVVVQLATDNSESVVDRVLVDVYLGESLRRAARHPPSVALVVDHHRRTCGNYRLLAVVKTPQAQSSDASSGVRSWSQSRRQSPRSLDSSPGPESES